VTRVSDSNNSPAILIRVLDEDADITAAFPLMHYLRPYLVAEQFLETVRCQQKDGFVLAGGYLPEDPTRPVALAGFRATRTLSAGPHLFVDDLVTDPTRQGRGHGKAMIDWLRRRAASLGLPRVYLDSRATAKGFYERVGFTFSTAIPCWISATDPIEKA
jgi:GNAT superfamily N-acetyltransferase